MAPTSLSVSRRPNPALSHSLADQFAERAVVERSILIKNLLEDLPDASTTESIPIPNVRSPAIQGYV
jgi:hypothetical protein